MAAPAWLGTLNACSGRKGFRGWSVTGRRLIQNRWNTTFDNTSVTAYIALIKEDAGIQHEDELVKAFNRLAKEVHPLALGNVKRSLSQSRMMAQKLLALHMDAANEAHKIDEIVANLTSKSYYHGHPINRREAKDHI